uniref:Putative LOC101238983 [Hydra vulgaris] n=1 Tax=Lepeophtheirus salmonis TaxID=72036 RepID=A0A0K2TT78_LEPSM
MDLLGHHFVEQLISRFGPGELATKIV